MPFSKRREISTRRKAERSPSSRRLGAARQAAATRASASGGRVGGICPRVGEHASELGPGYDRIIGDEQATMTRAPLPHPPAGRPVIMVVGWPPRARS